MCTQNQSPSSRKTAFATALALSCVTCSKQSYAFNAIVPIQPSSQIFRPFQSANRVHAELIFSRPSPSDIYQRSSVLRIQLFGTKDDVSVDETQESAPSKVINDHSERTEKTESGPTGDKLPPAFSTKTKSLVDFVSKKIGKVDEDRVYFPELLSGEVSRLFSNLKYDKPVSKATRAEGSTLGAAALVAGTAVGAGVLALPAAAAPSGFLPSTGGLCLAWGYMVMSGLLIAELSLNRIGVTGRTGSGILDLYKSSLGEPWAAVGSAAFFFLHYTVLVAYLAQGGNNLNAFLDVMNLGELAQIPGFGQILFASIGALSLYFAKPELVEKVNSVLVAAVGATFLGIIGFGVQEADFGALISPANQHPEMVVNAFPIFFLSVVFHNVVPTVVNQLEGDKKKIKTAIVAGTAAPLLMFIAWNAVILGNVMNASSEAVANMASGELDPIALLQSGGHGGPLLSSLVSIFSELAITTSIIGFVYGLIDALTDVTGLPADGPKFEQYKPLLFAGIFVPPLLFALSNPDIFYQALEYGGAFGVGTLFLLLPPIMVWKARYREEDTPLATMPMVPGGKVTLASMWKAAGTLIVEQLAEKVGLIDWIGDKISHLL